MNICHANPDITQLNQSNGKLPELNLKQKEELSNILLYEKNIWDLERKELSALLGALFGYILGRTSKSS
ncbi:MAG: hypothetical protein GWO07_09570 [Candidatus Dadabacteria bacterium]|nr:hypothetical protein [Candidatus Dadabacteria bacterium]NIS08995.1 hypothetical protein [Candidatus Dadabacteria bacterium]NIX15597.1 hypothetical protein [Candidatus Dadabacteria bacterium]NIY22338.1 hypothetical protein [Candidatus Dadabacteria bacterium]